MSKTKVYNRFDRPNVKGLDCSDSPSMTQQNFKDECDVNYIVQRYTKTGLWANSLRPGTAVPMFGDFTGAPEFTEAMNRIAQAKEAFDALPSGLRKRFNNDPAQLLDFLANDENRPEAEKMGLVIPKGASSPAGTPPAEVAQSPEAKK